MTSRPSKRSRCTSSNTSSEECVNTDEKLTKAFRISSEDKNRPQQIKEKEKSPVNYHGTTKSLNSPCLFVGNLHPHIIPDIHLRKLFEKYGTIQRISSIKHKTGHNAGQLRDFAFVEFTSIDSARLAMQSLHGRLLVGRKLSVMPAEQKTSSDFARSDEGSTQQKKKDLIGTGDVKKIQKEKSEIEKKIEAVKRAIEERKRQE